MATICDRIQERLEKVEEVSRDAMTAPVHAQLVTHGFKHVKTSAPGRHVYHHPSGQKATLQSSEGSSKNDAPIVMLHAKGAGKKARTYYMGASAPRTSHVGPRGTIMGRDHFKAALSAISGK